MVQYSGINMTINQSHSIYIRQDWIYYGHADITICNNEVVRIPILSSINNETLRLDLLWSYQHHYMEPLGCENSNLI